MKIYVASSWRNTRQPEVVVALREKGHDVYDFRNPAPGDKGFGWGQCAGPGEDPGAFRDQMQDPEFFRDHVLTHPIAVDGFKKDMTALQECDLCLLVLPCGRSAHLELGQACGASKKTIVLLDDPMSEPELMYLMLDGIACSMDEVFEMMEPWYP